MNVSPGISSIVCGGNLTLRTARGRKSLKPFLTLVCPQDGRHFRGFINEQVYVHQVLSRLEGQTPPLQSVRDVDGKPTPGNGSKTVLERPND